MKEGSGISEWDDETISRWWELFPPDRPTPPIVTAIPVGVQADTEWLTLDFLLGRIADIRKRGYASVDEEFEPGLVGVSAPVYGFRGDIVAALNVSAPKQRLGGHLRVAGEFTRSVADQLSATLGATMHRRNGPKPA